MILPKEGPTGQAASVVSVWSQLARVYFWKGFPGHSSNVAKRCNSCWEVFAYPLKTTCCTVFLRSFLKQAVISCFESICLVCNKKFINSHVFYNLLPCTTEQIAEHVLCCWCCQKMSSLVSRFLVSTCAICYKNVTEKMITLHITNSGTSHKRWGMLLFVCEYIWIRKFHWSIHCESNFSGMHHTSTMQMSLYGSEDVTICRILTCCMWDTLGLEYDIFFAIKYCVDRSWQAKDCCIPNMVCEATSLPTNSNHLVCQHVL